jgi:methyl-accepting chemotaxis protein
MKVVHKIALMPALAVAALLAIFFVVQVTRSANEDLNRRIETGYVPAVAMSQDLVEQLAALQRGLQDAVASSDIALLAETDALHRRFLDTVNQASENETLDSDQMEALGEDFRKYYELARQTSSRLINMEIGSNLQEAIQNQITRYNVIKSTLDSIAETSRENISAAFERSRANQTKATILYVVVLSLSIIALVALSISVVRSISQSMDRVVTVAAGVAEGELTRRIEIVSNDELGTMGSSINRALDRMREAVAIFGDNAGSLADASDDLSGISIRMAGGADTNSEQATMASSAAEQVSVSVEAVATGIEEMTVSIHEIARNSQEAARVAADAVASARSTNELITHLGERSNEISGVAKVISEIAQQTNLLALNATIEAARAGESGRGFAVVADEVKELARGTAAATEDISSKMVSIQEDINGAVGAIGEIAEVIDRISEIQTSIALAVEEQTATASEISRSINEAAHGTSEIAEHALQVAQSAQVTADGAGATRQAAEDLSSMADELKKLVAEFNYQEAAHV